MWRKHGVGAIPSVSTLSVSWRNIQPLSLGRKTSQLAGSGRGRLDATGVVLLLALAFGKSTAQAHRLDEYLQAVLIGIGPTEIRTQLSLTPGTGVADRIVSLLDIDHDGVVSKDEQQAYESRVLGDISLRLDSNPVPMELSASRFPTIEEMRNGAGIIQFEWLAKIPVVSPGRHVVSFQNRHLTNLSVYLANALAPATTEVAIEAQRRDYLQTEVFIDYSLKAPGKGLTRGRIDAKGSSFTPLILMTFSLVAGAVFALARSRRKSA